MKNEILINEIARLIEIDRNELDLNSPLVLFDNWDSLVIISIIAIVDEQFGFLLKGHEIDQCKTINDIFLLIENRKMV